MRSLLFLFILIQYIFTQAQQIVFERAYDFGLELERATSVIVESDGYIVGGATTSRIFNGGDSYRVIKVDSVGNIIWTNEGGIYGYEVDARVSGSLIKTDDKGYVFGGGVEDTVNFISDFCLIKFNQYGDTVFAKKYGGSNEDRGFSVAQTKDGGYAIYGQTESFGDLQGDFYLVKTDSNGIFSWQKTYDVAKDLGVIIRTTMDSGFILGGGARNRSTNNQSAYIIKTDSAGNIEWDKTYGTPGDDCGGGAFPTLDGGYVLLSCQDTIVNSLNPANPYYVAKLNDIGNIIWKIFFDMADEHSLL